MTEPTPSELLRAAIVASGLSATEYGRTAFWPRVVSRRTIQRWLASRPIPPSVLAFLKLQAMKDAGQE